MENMQETRDRGLQPIPPALTREQAQAIRDEWASYTGDPTKPRRYPFSQRAIADRYGVKQSVISQLLRGITYKEPQ